MRRAERPSSRLTGGGTRRYRGGESLLSAASRRGTRGALAHVLTKLAVRDRVQAVVFTYESGLIELGTAPP